MINVKTLEYTVMIANSHTNRNKETQQSIIKLACNLEKGQKVSFEIDDTKRVQKGEVSSITYSDRKITINIKTRTQSYEINVDRLVSLERS